MRQLARASTALLAALAPAPAGAAASAVAVFDSGFRGTDPVDAAADTVASATVAAPAAKVSDF